MSPSGTSYWARLAALRSWPRSSLPTIPDQPEVLRNPGSQVGTATFGVDHPVSGAKVCEPSVDIDNRLDERLVDGKTGNSLYVKGTLAQARLGALRAGLAALRSGDHPLYSS